MIKGNTSKIQSVIKKEDDGTIELTITVPDATVKKTREEVIAQTLKHAELPGFRKGKAPRNLVEKQLNREKLQEEILRKILPNAYAEAVQANNLRPIMNPKIHVLKLEEEKDWEFTAKTCEEPVIDLGDYKKRIQNVTAASKIIIPGKEQKKPSFDDIVRVLLDGVNAKIPGILLEQEVDKLLSQLLDEVKSLGLTLDQYLSSTGKNVEVLRGEYQQKAKNDLLFEFSLQKVAEMEKISIDEKEVEEAIQKAKDENERKNLEAHRYLLAGILRQQKTLDFLRNL